jgi:hypothetical protein
MTQLRVKRAQTRLKILINDEAHIAIHYLGAISQRDSRSVNGFSCPNFLASMIA